MNNGTTRIREEIYGLLMDYFSRDSNWKWIVLAMVGFRSVCYFFTRRCVCCLLFHSCFQYSNNIVSIHSVLSTLFLFS